MVAWSWPGWRKASPTRARGIEPEHATAGHQRLRGAAAELTGGDTPGALIASTRSTSTRPTVLLAEPDRARHHHVHERRAEAAGEARGPARPGADPNQVDVGLAIDLAAAEEEQVNPLLAGQVEQLARALGERIAAPLVQQRQADVMAELAHEPAGGGPVGRPGRG